MTTPTDIDALLAGFAGQVAPPPLDDLDSPEDLATYSSAFTGTEDQNNALDAIIAWVMDRNPKASQLACLLGLAGTGKSTVAIELIERVRYLGFSTAVCAPTGKAASVLRRKGCRDATTIHRAIYEPPEELDNGDLAWTLRRDSRQASLAIVDEASMITTDQLDDLRKVFGRILLVGDPGQLPPVSGQPALALPMPRHTLTTIHRQAEESGIIRFAHAIRAGQSPAQAIKVGGKDVIKGLAPESVPVGVSLCWKNQTRTGANASTRFMRDFKGPVPNVGETLMCLRNNADDGWTNGMMITVDSVMHHKGSDYARITGVCDDGETREARVWLDCLDMATMPRRDDIPRGLEPFWWGYAVTCHKAQGSEWTHVEIIESHGVFGKTPEERAQCQDTARRWVYTAATRAREKLYWGA